MRRKECRFPGCEHRRWKSEMAKVKWRYDHGTDAGWITLWVCRVHLPRELIYIG